MQPATDQNNGLQKKLDRIIGTFQDSLADVYDEILSQSAQLQTVNQIGRLLLSNLTARQVLESLMLALIDHFEVERASFWRVDHETQRVFFQFSLKDNRLEDKVSLAVEMGKGMVGEVAQNGRSLLVDDVHTFPNFYREADVETGFETRNALTVPIQHEGQTIGVVQLLNRRATKPFTREDEQLLTAIGPWLALALRNANLYAQIQSVNDLGEKLISTLDRQQVLWHLLAQLIEMFAVERGSFWLVDHEAQKVRLQFSLNKQFQQDAISAAMPAALDFGVGYVGKVAQTGTMIDAISPKSDARHYAGVDEQTQHTTRNVLTVPLLHLGQTIGIIQLLDRENDIPFSQDEQALLLAISPWVAHAWQNVTLYEEAIADQQRAYQMQLDAERRSKALALDANAVRMTREMTHQFKNNLGSAMFDVRQLLKLTGLSAQERRRLERIGHNIERSLEITKGLVKPYLEGRKTAVSPRSLVSQALDNTEIPVAVEVVNDVPPEIGQVYVEESHAVEHFKELLWNGLKAIRRGQQVGMVKNGRLHLHAQRNRQHIELFFHNNGPSIPQRDWDTIFEQFTRSFADSDSHNLGQNFGLGLWGARTFFRRQDGDVVVYASDEAQTTFLVTLPCFEDD